jgi:excisionase family DNA binding protein
MLTGKVFTPDEAAEKLQISKNMVVKIGRKLGACSVFGRHYRFDEADLAAIWEASRARIGPGSAGIKAPPLDRAYESIVARAKKKLEDRQKQTRTKHQG